MKTKLKKHTFNYGEDATIGTIACPVCGVPWKVIAWDIMTIGEWADLQPHLYKGRPCEGSGTSICFVELTLTADGYVVYSIV